MVLHEASAGMPPNAARGELARLLALRPPFDALAPEELGEITARAEIEFHLAGAVIFDEDSGPVVDLRVVHSGRVDLLHGERLLDVVGPGDSFGHAAILSGLAPGGAARAAQDTLCYRIPADVAGPLLARARRRELRVGRRGPAHQVVARLIRSPTLRCAPDEAVAAVARRMTRLGTDCAIVDLPGGEMGIVTDRDLRSRVVAAELPPDAPVSHVMTAPAYSVSADRLGAEVLFDMLERGIRHALILTRDGRLAGVVEDSDLFTLQPRSWFHARRAIERAADTAELAAVVQRLPAIVADLHAASVAAEEVARVISALVDAAVVRASALAATTLELPAEGVVWLALGSHARRELTLLSRPIGALAADVALPAEFLARLAETIEACGVPGMVTARPTASWEAAPLSDALAVALLVERRPLWGVPTGPLPALPAARREELLDALAARARAAATPTGFDGARVIAPDGTRSTRLELARTVLRPITTLARWAGACAGAQDGSTPERLAAAARADVLSEPEAARLTEAFTFTFSLRVAHHAELVSAGAPLVDAIDTAGLTPTTRDGLREAFRAIAAVQARLARR